MYYVWIPLQLVERICKDSTWLFLTEDVFPKKNFVESFEIYMYVRIFRETTKSTFVVPLITRHTFFSLSLSETFLEHRRMNVCPSSNFAAADLNRRRASRIHGKQKWPEDSLVSLPAFESGPSTDLFRDLVFLFYFFLNRTRTPEAGRKLFQLKDRAMTFVFSLFASWPTIIFVLVQFFFNAAI